MPGLVAFAYAIYPPVIFCLSRLFGRSEVPPPVDDAAFPRVSLLVAAYNEESVIGQHPRNALATDYPRDKFEAVIASDGSRDRTAEECALTLLTRASSSSTFRRTAAKRPC